MDRSQRESPVQDVSIRNDPQKNKLRVPDEPSPITGGNGRTYTSRRPRPISSSSEVRVFGRENLPASHVGCQGTSRKDLVVRDGHDILRENYKISELAGLD
jgi:hypothetical protein